MQISTKRWLLMSLNCIGKSLKGNWKIKSSGEATRADLQVRDKRWDESYSKTGAVLIWVIKKGETSPVMRRRPEGVRCRDA